MEDFQNDKNIIIEEADKGRAICITDTDFYASNISVMINDKRKEIESDNNRKIMNKIHKLTEQFSTCLEEEESDYIVNFEYKESNPCGLSKVHKWKSDEIDRCKSEYIVLKCPTDLKVYTIVDGPSSPTI